jgi:hypothetical protein
MARALRALPYDNTRALTWEWLKSDRSRRRRTAANLLEQHAAETDVPAILEYLRRVNTQGYTEDVFVILDLAAALARHADQGPYDEITAAFYGIAWTPGRESLAHVLAATDPSFGHTHAVECLWDSQAEVRILGAAVADRRDPRVDQRLRTIAADWAEDPAVQHAAQERLRR